MRRFYIADVNATGELRALAEYRYEQLEQIPGASDLIGTLSGAVWRSPREFETTLHDERSHLIMGQRMQLGVDQWGGYQGIIRDPLTGILMGGSDPRKDGLAIGY